MAKKSTSRGFDTRYLLALIPLFVSIYLLYYFSEIVSYVLIGWVLSMIGAPLVVFLRKYVGKNFAAGITLTGFICILGVLLWIFIPPLSRQARNLADIDYAELMANLEEPISDWEHWLEERGLVMVSPQESTIEQEKKAKSRIYTKVVDLDTFLHKNIISDSLQNNQNISVIVQIDANQFQDNSVGSEDESKTFFQQIKSNLNEYANPSMIPSVFRSVVGTLGNVVISLMSIFFIAFFFLREQGLFNTMIASVVPDKYEVKTIQAINESSSLLIRYFIGILAQITIITLFVSIVLKIIGVQNALLIGFFAALINIIPYIGPILGAMFAVLITVSSNLGLPFYDQMVPLLMKVIIVFVVMQLIDNFILQPNIFSKSVKAHPLEIFLIVLIGANVGGILGMVLAIPSYTVVRVIAKAFLSEFKVVQSLTRGL